MNEYGNDRIFQVSEITGRIKTTLEDHFSEVSVEGEISNFRPASSGHCYFALKDETAVIQCVLFRTAAARVNFEPRDGKLVQVRASVGVYPPRGTYQLIVKAMQPAGEGRILAMLEERKQRLSRAGMFGRALPLPWFPRTAAVITSPTGAAIRDIVQVLRRRGARVDIRILPVPVQGSDAAGEIARMIRYADRHHLGDVIVITRGGGSIEDLLPFSEEIVLNAIVSTSIPVISAVGHEIDWALSDFAADYRAPTPSAAAEVLSAGEKEVRDRLERAGHQIVREYIALLDRTRNRIERVSSEEIRYRYRNYVQPWYQRVDIACEEMRRAIAEQLIGARRRLEIATERIHGASPSVTLQRGYAIVRGIPDNTIITHASITHPGQRLNVQFTDAAVSVQRDKE